jgi:hypothetical protein
MADTHTDVAGTARRPGKGPLLAVLGICGTDPRSPIALDDIKRIAGDDNGIDTAVRALEAAGFATVSETGKSLLLRSSDALARHFRNGVKTSRHYKVLDTLRADYPASSDIHGSLWTIMVELRREERLHFAAEPNGDGSHAAWLTAKGMATLIVLDALG